MACVLLNRSGSGVSARVRPPGFAGTVTHVDLRVRLRRRRGRGERRQTGRGSVEGLRVTAASADGQADRARARLTCRTRGCQSDGRPRSARAFDRSAGESEGRTHMVQPPSECPTSAALRFGRPAARSTWATSRRTASSASGSAVSSLMRQWRPELRPCCRFGEGRKTVGQSAMLYEGGSGEGRTVGRSGSGGGKAAPTRSARGTQQRARAGRAHAPGAITRKPESSSLWM